MTLQNTILNKIQLFPNIKAQYKINNFHENRYMWVTSFTGVRYKLFYFALSLTVTIKAIHMFKNEVPYFKLIIIT